ncbi:MAG: NADH-quinone oxidoreductase subunit J [Planctomycetales bacterium]
MSSLVLLLVADAATGDSGMLLSRWQALMEQPQSAIMVRALLVLSLAAVGIYLMLPRGQRSGEGLARLLGGALATASLVLLSTHSVSSGMAEVVEGSQSGLLWELTGQPAITGVTFYILAVVSLGSAVMMITSRNPVYSALWFAVVLLGNSGLYLLQRAEFLAAASIIVYAGAIVVTFLFVIMLAQPSGAASYDRRSREPLLSGLTGLVLASALVGALHYSARMELRGGATERSILPAPDLIAELAELPGGRERTDADLEGHGHVAGLGKSLFVDHVVSVEVIGLLLLAAVVGAMLIAGHPVEPVAPPGSASS